MNFKSALVLIGVLFCATFTWAAEKNSELKELQKLIDSLADESFKVREDAARDLWQLGEKALPALDAAMSDADPEKSVRARDIKRRIMLGITPKTDPIVIELIERYAQAMPEDKLSIIKKLKSRRAWAQVLKLYAMESSQDLRAELQDEVDGMAIQAAREAILVGDIASARKYLELDQHTGGYMALADFFRSQGLLDGELKKLAADAAKPDAPLPSDEASRLMEEVFGEIAESWHDNSEFALMCAAGNTRLAADVARKMGHWKTAAMMSAIEGDPLPWLEQMQKNPPGNQLAAAYAKVAASWWKGEVLDDAKLDVFINALDSKSTSDRNNAINALLALGRFDLAEGALVKTHPLIAFKHYDILEKTADAMKVLGLKEDASNADEWLAGLLEELESLDIEEQHQPSTAMERIAALAYFNERRGLDERNDSIFLETGQLLSEKNPELFIRLVTNLFGRGEVSYRAPNLAKRMASKWAGQDPQRWEAVVAIVLGEEDVVNEWWDWLGDLDPGAGPSVRCDAMLAIFKACDDPGGIREKFMDRVWLSIDKAPDGERTRLLARMLTMAIESNDLVNTLKVMDRLPEKTRNAISWENRLFWLSAANRWDEAASLIVSQINEADDEAQEPNVEIHAYAAACLRLAGNAKEAVKHDRLADQLALGDPAACMRIANGYAFGLDFERAGEWWKRALIYANSESDLDNIALYLKFHADELLERSDWPKAAAAMEVLSSIVVTYEPRWLAPSELLRMRLHADMSRALAKLKTDRKAAIELLGRCQRNAISDGSLADYFLPAVRKAGLQSEHDQWFRASWDFLRSEISKFPDNDQLRNTAAWFASRSMRELVAAEKDIAIALEHDSDQAAYLDTMAEVQFAKGNRAKAIEWSDRAMKLAPDDDQIRRQSARFRKGPFPTK